MNLRNLNPLKFFQRGKKKDFARDAGFSLIRRYSSAQFSKTQMLEQYTKSLYVFACISKIAEKVASTELKLYRILNSKGDTKEIQTHPALDLLYKVNPFQTKTEFLETTMINLKASGDAFWWKIRNNGGTVVELWNLRPDWMVINKDPVNFIKSYQFTTADGQTIEFDPEDIVHIKSTNPLDMYFGMSPVQPAQVRIQTEDSAAKYQSDFFLNNARPDAVIKNTGESTMKASTKDEIRRSWNLRHQGPGNNSKVAILDANLEYQQISLNQREMDYIESMKFTRDDILVAFKVPKPIVAITDDVNRANAETAMFIFLSETIVPEIRKLVEKINEELIAPDFGDEFFIGFVDPTPQNREATLNEYQNGITNNWLLINEVRARENLPPIKGGWSFYMPLVNSPMGGLSQGDQKSLSKLNDLIEATDKNPSEEIENKKFDFKGKFWLKQKFIIYETMQEAVSKTLAEKPKSKSKNKIKKGKKKTITSLIGADIKEAYTQMVLKRIDKKSEKLKDGVDKFAAGQKERVMSDLSNIKSKAKLKKFTISQIFDKKKEDGLAIDFIIPYLEAYLKEAGIDAIDMLAPQETFENTKRTQEIIKKRSEFFAESVNSTTLQKLDATLAEGIDAGESIHDLGNRVSEVYDEFSVYRSELIARTEATAANNEGLLEGFRQSDVANAKEWIAVMDDRTRPEHAELNGTIILLDEAFSNGLKYPQEPNCRCVLGPAFIE